MKPAAGVTGKLLEHVEEPSGLTGTRLNEREEPSGLTGTRLKHDEEPSGLTGTRLELVETPSGLAGRRVNEREEPSGDTWAGLFGLWRPRRPIDVRSRLTKGLTVEFARGKAHRRRGRRHRWLRDLWEDFYDTLLAQERRAATRESLAEVKRKILGNV